MPRIVRHKGERLGESTAFMARSSTEPGSTTVTIRSAAYFGWPRIAAIGSTYRALYASSSPGPGSPCRAAWTHARPGRLWRTTWKTKPLRPDA
nr:hypothetical protein [Streptomyces sp. UH6]